MSHLAPCAASLLAHFLARSWVACKKLAFPRRPKGLRTVLVVKYSHHSQSQISGTAVLFSLLSLSAALASASEQARERKRERERERERESERERVRESERVSE